MPVLEGKELRIVGFLCNWCSYGGADTAGVARAGQPTDLRIIRVPCSGRIDPLFVLKALLNGADGVLMLGMRVVPDGRVVQTSPLRDSLDGSSTGNPWGEIGKDFGGGYGSIRSKSYGTSQTYDRIIRVQLLRFKRDTEGRFMPKPKNAPVHTGTEAIKTMKEIKEELKNAKAD